MCLWRTGSELDQASSDGSVTSGDESATGFANLILSHRYTVASSASVGIHAEAMVADTADFGTEIAYTHFTGTAFSQTLATLQGLEYSVRLGFGIDQFHRISFL
jgi:hypothetical protein